MRREFVLGFKAPVHTNPFWFENATFSLWIRLPSTRIRWKPSMKTELFENAHLSGTLWKHCFSVYVWTEQNGTFRKRWRHTISFKRWWTGASLSCLLSLGLFLTSNCLFSSKFSFVNSSSWLLQKVTEHYQVSFATGVKRRKVGSPFSLTLFLPWIWHFKLFLRLWRTSQLYKPTPKKFKGGANLLFRGLIIANTYASSMRSRVSFRFQIDLSYRRIFVYTFCLINIYFWLCDDAKKIKKSWILKGHNSFSYLWKFEPNTPDGFGEMLLSKLQTDFTENHGSLTFLPHSNFAVFYGWYFLQYCL